MMAAPIYLDHAATCPPLPAVVSAMATALTAGLGNPSARHHAPGRAAAELVEQSRSALADLLRTHPDTLVFTSGATEAIAQAVLGTAERLLPHRPVWVAGAADHAAVHACLARTAAAGAELRILPVDRDGRPDPGTLDRIDDRTALVCWTLVNNETGVIHDPAPVAERCRRHGALLLLDASQAPLRMALDLPATGADLAVLSAHKMHGPAGLGALWIRRGLDLPPLIPGGGQEGGRRGGTPPAWAHAGWAAACRWLAAEGPGLHRRLLMLTDRLETGLRRGLPGVVIHGGGAGRAPGITMATLPGLGRRWLPALRRIAASAGSACGSGTGEPSRVLAAMGVPAAQAATALRLSSGAGTSASDIDLAIEEAVAGARA
jgi:cysteine desulfurase